MIKAETIEILKNLISEILRKMTFDDFTIEIREENNSDGENLILNIAAKEADLLIGQYGANLLALQHVTRALARKKTEEKLRFSVDVNDYRREKTETIEELAVNMAKQAINEKRAVVLRPMNAYERRIVHLALDKNEQVKTESIGAGEERKVVIKPVGEIENIQ